MSEYFVIGDRKFVPQEPEPAVPSVTYYRAPHDLERYNVNIDNYTYIKSRLGYVRNVVVTGGKSMPEVYRFLPFHHVILTERLQWLWRNINPELSDEKWSTLLGYFLAWCNGTGFGDPTDPRANYITGENLGKPDPAFDQARFCGGAIFKGTTIGNVIYITTIPSYNPPSAEFVLKNSHLWYWGTSVSPKGDIYYIRRLGLDGTLKKVRIPLITSKAVYLPKTELHQLPEGTFPYPTWIHP